MAKPQNHGGVLVPWCPYCAVPAELQYRTHGRRWECPTAGCDARVGVHKHSPRGAPLGTLARGPLRQLRKQVHEAFDPIWRNKPALMQNRSAAYAWLAEYLGVTPSRCHIGEFDEAQCRKALAAISALKEVPR